MAAGGSDLTWQTQRVDGGTIFVQSGGSPTADPASILPQVTLAVEHYNRMVRLLEHNTPSRSSSMSKLHCAKKRSRTASTSLAKFPAPTRPTRSSSSARTSIRGTAVLVLPITPPDQLR
jgi:hypothetical protein